MANPELGIKYLGGGGLFSFHVKSFSKLFLAVGNIVVWRAIVPSHP